MNIARITRLGFSEGENDRGLTLLLRLDSSHHSSVLTSRAWEKVSKCMIKWEKTFRLHVANDWVIIYRTVYVISVKILAVYKAAVRREEGVV